MKTKQVTGGGWRVIGKLMLCAGLLALGLEMPARAAQFQLTSIPVPAGLVTVQTNAGASASSTYWITNNGAAFPLPQGVAGAVLYAIVTINGTNKASTVAPYFGFDTSGDPTGPQPITSPTNFTTTLPFTLTGVIPNPAPFGYTNLVLEINVPLTNITGRAYARLSEVGVTAGTNITINSLGMGFYY